MMMKNKLKSNLIPNWNFGPLKKNCANVNFIAREIIKKWPESEKIIQITKNKKFHESKFLSLDINKAKKELNWKPRLDFNETIQLTVDWYKNYFSKNKLKDISIRQIEYFINKK
jgi:CDP-glucose 4,6-dehydratase